MSTFLPFEDVLGCPKILSVRRKKRPDDFFIKISWSLRRLWFFYIYIYVYIFIKTEILNEWMNGPTCRPDLTLKSRNRNRPRRKKINKPKQKREKNFDVLTIWIKVQEMRRARRENPVLLEKRGEGSSFYRCHIASAQTSKEGGRGWRPFTHGDVVCVQTDWLSLAGKPRALSDTFTIIKPHKHYTSAT